MWRADGHVSTARRWLSDSTTTTQTSLSSAPTAASSATLAMTPAAVFRSWPCSSDRTTADASIRRRRSPPAAPVMSTIIMVPLSTSFDRKAPAVTPAIRPSRGRRPDLIWTGTTLRPRSCYRANTHLCPARRAIWTGLPILRLTVSPSSTRRAWPATPGRIPTDINSTTGGARIATSSLASTTSPSIIPSRASRSTGAT